MLRQGRWIDFYYGPNHYEMPIWSQGCNFVQQGDIKALVYHTKESQARKRNTLLIQRLHLCAPALSKVIHIDAAGKSMHRRVLLPLCLVEALATCEYQINGFEKLLFIIL